MDTSVTETKLKFELLDGTFMEFEPFTPNPQQMLYCYLPPLKPTGRARTQAAYIYVRPEDYAVAQRDRYKKPITEAEKKVMRIGILSEGTSHPFPKGIYIPYHLEPWGGCEHSLGEVYGEFVFSSLK
jgi:hypothetical protein